MQRVSLQLAVKSLTVACFALLITGCSLRSEDSVADAASDEIQGSVIGGQQPIAGATVTVWLMGTSGYGAGATQLASTTTDPSGNFKFASNAYACGYSNEPVYITASGGDPGGGSNANLVLAAGLGTCIAGKAAFVNINEVSTIVTAYALSHFFTTAMGGDYTTDLIGGPAAGSGSYNAGLVRANSYTIPNLVALDAGSIKANTSTMTIESTKIYSLANILAACVNSSGQSSTTDTTTACGKLFSYTTVGASRPMDTFQAAVRIALYPYKNVSLLYGLISASAPFTGLSSAPNDWTIGVSYSASSFGLGINGSANSRTSSNIDIDANGNIWFPTNSASNHGLAYFSPASLTFNGPYATSLIHPQYVAITSQGLVYGSDLAGAQIAYVTSSNPATGGTTVTTTGYTGPLVAGYYSPTLDGVYYTGGGTASTPGSTLYEYTDAITTVNTYAKPPNGLIAFTTVPYVDASTGASTTVCSYESYLGFQSVRVSTSTSPCYAGGIANTTNFDDGVMTVASTNQLCDYRGFCFISPVTLATPEGIALDGDSNLWVANSGNASVSTFGYSFANENSTDYYATSTVPYIHDSTNGSTMTMPYGIAIDRSGNVWTSNASCVTTTSTACTPNGFTLSELIGAAAPTLTPLALTNVNGNQGSRPNSYVSFTTHSNSTLAAPSRRSR